MGESMTIPVLPCVSLPETLAFYENLGFEVTHQQKVPNVYGAIQRGDVHLHFMGIKGLDPARAVSTCLVIVPEVESLHRHFAEALRKAYGKLPLSGLPRISRMRKGQSRFRVTDVDGNSVIFIKSDEDHGYGEEAPEGPPPSRLARALETARVLRDFKNDDATAAKMLDVALSRDAKDGGSPPLDRARALAARAELAVALGDEARAGELRAELAALELTAEQRAQLQPELDALDELERSQR